VVPEVPVVVVFVVPAKAQNPLGQYAGQLALHQASVAWVLVAT